MSEFPVAASFIDRHSNQGIDTSAWLDPLDIGAEQMLVDLQAYFAKRPPFTLDANNRYHDKSGKFVGVNLAEAAMFESRFNSFRWISHYVAPYKPIVVPHKPINVSDRAGTYAQVAKRHKVELANDLYQQRYPESRKTAELIGDFVELEMAHFTSEVNEGHDDDDELGYFDEELQAWVTTFVDEEMQWTCSSAVPTHADTIQSLDSEEVDAASLLHMLAGIGLTEPEPVTPPKIHIPVSNIRRLLEQQTEAEPVDTPPIMESLFEDDGFDDSEPLIKEARDADVVGLPLIFILPQPRTSEIVTKPERKKGWRKAAAALLAGVALVGAVLTLHECDSQEQSSTDTVELIDEQPQPSTPTTLPDPSPEQAPVSLPPPTIFTSPIPAEQAFPESDVSNELENQFILTPTRDDGFQRMFERNYGLEPEQAFKLYKQLENRLVGISGTYMYGSEVRLYEFSTIDLTMFRDEIRRFIEEAESDDQDES